MGMQNLFSKDFTLVVVGQIVSLFGNAILRFALPLYLLRATGSAAIFGLVTACSFLPMIFLSFLGGVLADRVNKRNIMVGLDFLTAGVVVVLWVSMEIVPIVPLFIVILMLLYGISGTYQPAVQASIPALVSKEHILSAAAVINQINALAGLLGPIIGGFLFGSFGIVPILLMGSLCFFASAVMELFIRIPFQKRSGQEGVLSIIKGDFRDSLHYLKVENPNLISIIILICLFNLVLSAMLIVGMPILIIETLALSDKMLGFAQGILAFGGLWGGLLTALLSRRLKLSNSHWLLACSGLGVTAIALVFLAGAPELICYGAIAVGSFFIMVFATMFSVQMMATVQTQTPPELVGKVIALMMSLAMCAQPLGQALYGLAFDYFAGSEGVILAVAAILSLFIALMSKRIFERMA